MTGHYKAEEWSEDKKAYFINDQLGIQIVVQVGPLPLLVLIFPDYDH
jgi:hypothetical protein